MSCWEFETERNSQVARESKMAVELITSVAEIVHSTTCVCVSYSYILYLCMYVDEGSTDGQQLLYRLAC